MMSLGPSMSEDLLGKKRAEVSVVVIGYQPEDHRMYPHLFDFLQHLRRAYGEVVYLDDDDRGDGLYSFDRFLHNIVSMRGCRALVRKVRYDLSRLLCRSSQPAMGGEGADASPPPSFGAIVQDITATFRKLTLHIVKRRRLIVKLKSLELRYGRRLLIAIDHTAVAVATRYFPGKVVLWSFDIPTKDYDSNHHMRIRNGLYERIITARGAVTDTLMIQDERRKELLEEALEFSFAQTIYLPVSLNDSPFCAASARARGEKERFTQVRVIQCGGLGKNRFTDRLISSYQEWPAHYALTLHGVLFSHDMREVIEAAPRKPELTAGMYHQEEIASFLNRYDIGFVGYGEKNRNHDHIENASAQLVAFLRLGIPVVACGSASFNEFINEQGIGVGVAEPEEIVAALATMVADYPHYSRKARELFEARFDLACWFNATVLPAFTALVSLEFFGGGALIPDPAAPVASER